MKNRRKGRECALQIMYEIEVLAQHKTSPKQNPQKSLETISKNIINKAIKDTFANFKKPAEIFKQSSTLIIGTLNNIKQIDNIIQKHSLKWRLERILKVDRNILRLASYELFFSPNLSIGIIINEAIEIARKFSSEKSASFVNGILDAISKDARKNISNKKSTI